MRNQDNMTNNLLNTIPFLMAFLLLSLTAAQHCRPFGHFYGTAPPPGKCDTQLSHCCELGKVYHAYHCSPPLAWEGETRAVLTLNSFRLGGPAQCDKLLHSDDEAVVALPTGWYGDGRRCGKEIEIRASNGRSVRAKVVDECDSTWGCDEMHAYEAPCRHNAIDASRGVWKELGVPEGEWKELNVTWVDL